MQNNSNYMLQYFASVYFYLLLKIYFFTAETKITSYSLIFACYLWYHRQYNSLQSHT